MEDDELAELLHTAAGYEFGVAVKTNAPERLRLRLYPVARMLEMEFSFQIPTEPGTLWVVPKRFLPVPTRPGVQPLE